VSGAHGVSPLDGWIDRLPTWLRDLIIAVTTAILGVAGMYLVPAVESSPKWALLAPLITSVLAWATRATRAYGSGSYPEQEQDS
jgi:hypothetical protein